MNANQNRHGDVLIEYVESLPSGLKKSSKDSDRTVSYGETQGHGHVLTGNVDVYPTDTGYYVVVPPEETDARIRHLMVSSGAWTEKHHDIPLKAGSIAFISQQYEYDPHEEVMREQED